MKTAEEILIGLNAAIDNMWNKGRTDLSERAIVHWQKESKKYLDSKPTPSSTVDLDEVKWDATDEEMTQLSMYHFEQSLKNDKVDLEREAEEKYPIDESLNKCGTLLSYVSHVHVKKIERAAYIKGRQTTSQKGLVELIEWAKNCNKNALEESYNFCKKGMEIYQLRSEGMATAYELTEAKATELLTKK